MRLESHRTQIYRRVIFKILFALQLTILVGTYLHARTPLLWIWSILSFIPAVIVCLYAYEKKYVLPSLVILFVSQQAIFIFANPTWGFSFGGDAINDFHTALVMSESVHFELGQLGYASRLSYSYYPMLHLFSVTLSRVSGVSLISVAHYFAPILNALLTTFLLYHLNHDLFGLKGRERNIATLFFEMSFYYTNFDSQFVRESFAFPLLLLSLWTATRIAKLRVRENAIVAAIFFAGVVLSHHVSSYLLFVILAIMTLSFNVFYRNNRLNPSLFLMVLMLGAYTSFVVWTFSVRQAIYAYEGFQVIFQREGLPSVMRPYEPWRVNVAFVYYAIICAFTLIAGIKLLRQKRKNWVVITVISFFLLSFLLSVLLRLSTSAHPWSFTYYMSLRGTIWAFIGISVLLALGIKYTLKLDAHISLKSYFAIVLIVCILAAGKFSQYPLLISDPTIAPDVTYPRYTTALWLKEEAVHGSNILVAPYESDMKAFDGSRSMAPYAYLREYFLDEAKGRSYDKFSGYIPLIGGFFDQYTDLPDVQIIYSNGDADVGYKQR
jgi:hypothetical protein